MLRRVALVTTDVAEERVTFLIRLTRIGALETKLAVTSKRITLKRNTFSSNNISSQRASVASYY
jgi:hypothetical protein